MKTFLDKLLEYYEMSIDDYNKLCEEVTFSNVPNLSFFNSATASKDCLKKHIENNDLIAVYGDYDADGILATSILVYTFKYLKFKNYLYYIPTREEDGYGITKSFVEKCIKDNVKLIITVDNGICAKETLDYAISNGIDVIIADHHEFDKESLPNTPYIIHPSFSEKPEVICSGGFTSYILASGLLEKENPYILSLAGISIITDMMPLIDYNKKVVKLALKFINEYKFAPICYLNEFEHIDENSISSSIGPKINSYGRIMTNREINEIVEFFMSKNPDLIEERGAKINEINALRKEKSQTTFDLSEFENENANVILADIPEGIMGLSANRLLNSTNKLSIVCAINDEKNGIIKGSGRSKEGISLLKLLEENSDILLNYGGHDLSGGLTIKKENFDEFKKRVFAYTKDKVFIEKPKKLIKINETEITYENYQILENFGPFGEKNKKPEFLVQDFPVRSLNYSKNNLHIYTKINKDGTIIMFNYNPDDLKDKKIISFEGTFALNVFKNVYSTKFVINKIIWGSYGRSW